MSTRQSLHWVSLVLALTQGVVGHPTTTPATLPSAISSVSSQTGIILDPLSARLPGHRLFKRRDQCDQSQFFCPTGTCFTDPANGYIGCCTVSSCAPRTRCIEYDASITTQPCDTNTGGCLFCSESATPYCFTITNEVAHQWIQYCATTAATQTLSYRNLITTGSQWTRASTTSSASATQSSSTSTPTSNSAGSAIPAKSSTNTAAAPVAEDAASTASSNGNSTGGGNGHVSLSAGSIGGIATGGVVGGLIVAAAIWFARKWLCGCARRQPKPSTETEKRLSDADSAPAGTESSPAEAEGSTPPKPTYFYSPSAISRCEEADSRPISTIAPHPAVRVPNNPGKGLGIVSDNTASPKRNSRYTLSNPDPPSTTSDSFPSAHSSKADASAVSPLTHFTPDPNSPTTPTTIRQVPPETTHDIRQAHTPSAYTAKAPNSIPRTTAETPPSLSKDYSAATLRSGVDASPVSKTTRYYRGLSGFEGDGPPPWAYLSPEVAVSGGWKNGPDATAHKET